MEAPSTPQGRQFSEREKQVEYKKGAIWSEERLSDARHSLVASGWAPAAAEKFVKTAQRGRKAIEKDMHDKEVAGKAKAVEEALQELNESTTEVEELNKRSAEMQVQLEKMKEELAEIMDGREQKARKLLELQTELYELLFSQEGQMPYRQLQDQVRMAAKECIPEPVAKASRAAGVAMGRVQTEEEYSDSTEQSLGLKLLLGMLPVMMRQMVQYPDAYPEPVLR
ncbi:hypothetical protein LPJ61_006360, partial [Coemansia biformis]